MFHDLKREGLSISAISRRTGCDRKTIKKYLDRGLEVPVYNFKSSRTRLSGSFRNYLIDRVTEYSGLSGVRLHREIKAMGYKGAYSTLTDYLRLIRPPRPFRFECRFETAPGQQAQVDFAEFQVEFTDEPGVCRKVWLFSHVLGHSRFLWGHFCPNQKLETVLRCHINAFEACGGVTSEILYDRMKTAVLGEDEKGTIIGSDGVDASYPYLRKLPR